MTQSERSESGRGGWRGWGKQGRFQDFFQGVAEISSGGGENPPGGGEKNFAAPPSPQHFFAFLHTILLIYAHFFYILGSCYKELHKIYIFFLFFFLFVFYILYASMVPLNVLGSEGSKPLLNGHWNAQRVARWASPPPWNRLFIS